uniref:Tetratricopeptide repeat domain 23 n=1 Tax=Neogobius melanostomus TaxID=47308 RepID=A0A8C6UK47_9GOBI
MDSSSAGEEDTCGGPLVSKITERPLLLMPPEEKLQHFDSSAQTNADNKEYDACIKDLVRCLALVKLVHGDGHFKLAQAHSRLAKAYLQYKGWGEQAWEHASSARRVLGLCTGADRLSLRLCLLTVSLTQGEAALLTQQLAEAERAFLQAEELLGQMEHGSGLLRDERAQTELDICTGLSRVYRRQGRVEEALLWCERSLQRLTDSDQPLRSCAVYRDMAELERDRGDEDRAVELLLKAHTTALTQTPAEERQGAALSHSLALLLSASAQSRHNDVAGEYFEQSLALYRRTVGERDPAFLTAQDDFCRFLLLRGQHERCLELQKAALPCKRALFGDLSEEVADALQLTGSVQMTQGQLLPAYRSMAQCLEVQSVLFGPRHKKPKPLRKRWTCWLGLRRWLTYCRGGARPNPAPAHLPCHPGTQTGRCLGVLIQSRDDLKGTYHAKLTFSSFQSCYNVCPP